MEEGPKRDDRPNVGWGFVEGEGRRLVKHFLSMLGYSQSNRASENKVKDLEGVSIVSRFVEC